MLLWRDHFHFLGVVGNALPQSKQTMYVVLERFPWDVNVPGLPPHHRCLRTGGSHRVSLSIASTHLRPQVDGCPVCKGFRYSDLWAHLQVTQLGIEPSYVLLTSLIHRLE